MALEPRRRYFHGAVDVSTLGKNEPKIFHGDGMVHRPAEGSPSYNVLIVVPAAQMVTGATINVGWLTQGCWWGAEALINHSAQNVAATIGVQLGETAPAAGDEITIFAAAAGWDTPGPVASTANYAPVAEDRMLQLVLGGTVDAVDTIITLTVNPTTPEWH